MTFDLSGIEVAALDFGAVARFLDPAAYAGGVGDGVWRTAVGTVSYGELSVEGKDTTIKLGRVLARDMRVRQAPKPFAEAFDRLIANPDLPEVEAKALAADAGLDFASGFSLGRLSMQSIFVSGPDEDDQIATVALKDFSVRDVSLAGIGAISLRKLGIETAASNNLSLDRFLLGDLTFPSVDAIRAAIAEENAGRTPDPTTLVPQLALIEAAGAIFKFGNAPGERSRKRALRLCPLRRRPPDRHRRRHPQSRHSRRAHA